MESLINRRFKRKAWYDWSRHIIEIMSKRHGKLFGLKFDYWV